jgi:hypothetical protein
MERSSYQQLPRRIYFTAETYGNLPRGSSAMPVGETGGAEAGSELEQELSSGGRE